MHEEAKSMPHWHSHLAPLLLPVWLMLYALAIWLLIHIPRAHDDDERRSRRRPSR